jgi:hypothetical protein
MSRESENLEFANLVSQQIALLNSMKQSFEQKTRGDWSREIKDLGDCMAAANEMQRMFHHR